MAVASSTTGTAIGRARGRERNGEYTRGGTRQETDAACAWRGDGEGDSPRRTVKRNAEAAATRHLWKMSFEQAFA